MPSSLQTLRIIGFLEGLSFLLLLGYAMPLKYLWGEPAAVQQIGMAHDFVVITPVYCFFSYSFF